MLPPLSANLNGACSTPTARASSPNQVFLPFITRDPGTVLC